jgi:hypothetical protein
LSGGPVGPVGGCGCRRACPVMFVLVVAVFGE